MMDHILATILIIDIKIIVKTRMLHKVIYIMWEERKLDFNILDKYILKEKSNIVDNIQTSTQTNQIVQIQPLYPQQETIL